MPTKLIPNTQAFSLLPGAYSFSFEDSVSRSRAQRKNLVCAREKREKNFSENLIFRNTKKKSWSRGTNRSYDAKRPRSRLVRKVLEAVHVVQFDILFSSNLYTI